VNGWPALLVWALAAGVLHVRGRRRLMLAARARHEVRGPLCTAQLALDGLEPSARVTAIGMELRRAALALDDLAPSLGRRTARAGLHAQRPRGSFHAVDVARLLADAAPVWRAVAEARGVALIVEPAPALVSGDPLRIAQACANLVHNAIEHGGGTVRVTSATARGRVRVDVADQGSGLPGPLADLVGAARGRLSARGHGLAIAAAIAEHHGGRLTSSPASRGARLTLDLPAAAARRTATPVVRDSKPVP
jgi:signal transduction histidine kinase